MGFEDDGAMVNSAASDRMGGDSSGVADIGGLPGDPAGDGLTSGGDWASPDSSGDVMADNTSVGSVDVCT